MTLVSLVLLNSRLAHADASQVASCSKQNDNLCAHHCVTTTQ